MRSQEYFLTMADTWDGEIVVCALGTSSVGWWNVTHSRDTFYLNAAMGFASSFGLGLAAALPEQRIWVLDSDGGTCMNLGGFITEADLALPNFTRIILNNHGYASLGNRPIPGQDAVDYAAIARGAGIAVVRCVGTATELRSALGEGRDDEHRNMVVIVDVTPDEVESESLEGPLPIPYEGAEMKYEFGRRIEASTGRQVFNSYGL